MKRTRIPFTVNQYNMDGVVFDKCILLHISDSLIVRIESLMELDKLIDDLQYISREIREFPELYYSEVKL